MAKVVCILREPGTWFSLCCFGGMLDPFDKADRWRCRAEELRTLAGGMHERDARVGLLKIADALEHHAGQLEDMALRLPCYAPVFRAGATESVPEAAD